MSIKRSMRGVPIAVLSTIVMMMHCANPVDEPPLRWRSNFQVPISNERFIVGKELPNLFPFEDDLDILNVLQRYYDDPTELQPDTILGDTVIFSVSETDSAEFESHEEPFEDKEFHVTLGPIPISGAPVVQYTLPIPGGAFSQTLPVTLDSVSSIDFYTTTTNRLQIKLTNSGAATYSNVRIGIADVDTADAVTIGPGLSTTVFLDVSGKSVGHTVNLYVAGSSGGAVVDSLKIEFSLNGLKASQLQVKDYLVDFSVEFINPYELTDTVNIEYIDIADGFFSYRIMNYSDLMLEVHGIHEHMWRTTFALQNNLTNIDSLVGLTHDDTMSAYMGEITNEAITTVSPNIEATFKKSNLSSCRMFAEWDTTLLKSVTKVSYTVSTLPPEGKTITLRASDSLVFTISTTSFKFKELQGRLMETYERESDTQKVAINLPWNNSVKDSLRGNFILKKVWGDILLSTVMPPRSFLDSLSLDFVGYVPDSTSVRDSMATVLVNVGPDSSYFRSIDITHIANSYSDSVAFAVKVNVPKGTRMRVVNDLDAQEEDFDRYIGRMIIHVATNYRLNAKLDWEVLDTVNMDLGTSRFSSPEAMRFLQKLEDRTAEFEMWITNNSNLNLSLLVLVAPDALMDTLDSLTMNEVYALLKHPDAGGYVKLFGDTGILVPKRDTTFEQYNVVSLDEEQLETLLTADSLNYRWWIQFKAQDRDALTDTDYIDLRSRLRVDGINSTDSLLIWE